MKIPQASFLKKDNYTSLWQREAGRDLKKIFSDEYMKKGGRTYGAVATVVSGKAGRKND
jgi:hypothetical protein